MQMAKNAQAEMVAIGLQDEGGMVDEESGNEVPNGALKEEVRDDQPAMLSPGEFVIPAYAVRYIGVERLVSLLREAKQGMEQLDDIGLTGEPNADDAGLETAMLPSDMQEGEGSAAFAVGGLQQQPTGVYGANLNQPTQQQFGTQPFAAPTQQQFAQPAAFAPPPVLPSPLSQPQYKPTVPIKTDKKFTYPELIATPGPTGLGYGVAEYVGPDGKSIFITTVGGKPLSKIPPGFKTRDVYDKDKAEEKNKTTAPPTAMVRKPEDFDPGTFEAPEPGEAPTFEATETTNDQIQGWADHFAGKGQTATMTTGQALATLGQFAVAPAATIGSKVLGGLFSWFSGKSKDDQATQFMTIDNKFMPEEEWATKTDKEKSDILKAIATGDIDAFNPGYVEGEAGSVAPSESLATVQTVNPLAPNYMSPQDLAAAAVTGGNVVVDNTNVPAPPAATVPPTTIDPESVGLDAPGTAAAAAAEAEAEAQAQFDAEAAATAAATQAAATGISGADVGSGGATADAAADAADTSTDWGSALGFNEGGLIEKRKTTVKKKKKKNSKGLVNKRKTPSKKKKKGPRGLASSK
jgi:hypothetical protein